MKGSFGAQGAPQLTHSAIRWLALLKKSLPTPEELQQHLEQVKKGFELESDAPGKSVGVKSADSPCPTGTRHSSLASSISSQTCAKTEQIPSSNPNQTSSNLKLGSPENSTTPVAVAVSSDSDCMLQQIADEIRQKPITRLQSEDKAQSHTSSQLQAFKVSVPKGYPGIQYRRSKNLEDRYERYAKSGTVVTGEVEDGGSWLKIGSSVFLPMHVAGLDVLEPTDASEAEAARAEMSKPLSQDAYPWLTTFSCGQFYDK